MLLWYMTVSCILFGSSAGITYEEICYGSNLRLPFDYIPQLFRGQMYFTPSNGGSRKLVMDNGEAKDPRLKINFGSVHFDDLTEDGTFSTSFDDDRLFDIITVKILDCATKVRRYYGAIYYCEVPRHAEFLEFTPLHSLDQPKVLWNRTNPYTNMGGRGRVRGNIWELFNLTQADSGYYNFRRKGYPLMYRALLTVKGYDKHYDKKVNERLFIQYPSGFVSWTVTFTSEGEMEYKTLMKEGNLVADDGGHFTGRSRAMRDGIEIHPVKSTDSGTLEFKDRQGNVALTVQVVVDVSAPAFVYVAITVGIIFALIFCCCCVRKCCCKKSSSKRDESSPQTAAAPAVYYHDINQPASPSYSAAPAPDYSYRPTNPLVSREPTSTSLGPSVCDPVNIHVNPPDPEVAPLGGQGAAPAPSLGSDCLSLNPEPVFELKGLTFPSAPPLSSDSTLCNVYTSDKINFL